MVDTAPEPIEAVSYLATEVAPPTVLSVFQAALFGGPGHSWWRVVAVDEAGLDPALLEGLYTEITSWTPRDDVGYEETWHPHSYSGYECDPDDDDMKVWDGESRVFIGSHGIRSRAIVEMFGSGCSGVLLGEGGTWVLTAAHCVRNPANNAWLGVPEAQMFVSADPALGHTTGFDSSASTFGVWAGGDPGANDWALLKLVSPMQDVSWMDIFQGTNATFINVGATIHNAGFPGFILDANQECEAVSGPYRLDDAEVFDVTPLETRIHSDGSGGQSGSPYFFCPGGSEVDVCEGGERGEVITVHSGWRWGLYGSRHVGPTPAQWRSPVLTWMAQN